MIFVIRFSSRRFLSTLNDLGHKMKKLNDNGEFRKAIALYENQIEKRKQRSDSLIANQALKACIELGDIEHAKDIHKNLPFYMANNAFIQTSLIRFYMKCGDYEKSKQIFSNSKNKTTAMFNNFLKGLLDNNRAEEALKLFREINIPTNEYTFSILFKICTKIADQHSFKFGKSVFAKMPKKFHNHVVLTAALHMFIQGDDLESAESLFDRMNRTIESYGAMMKFYNINIQPEKTLELFQRIKQENLNPDAIIFVLLIDALSVIGHLELSQSLIDEMPNNFLLDPWIQNGLIDLWGKIGLPDKSKQIFDIVKHPDSFAFGAMINTYGLNGMGGEAFELFNKVPSDLVNHCIYVCVLNACSHSALIDPALKVFEKIPLDQRTEQIYTTMVDAFSRVFLFEKAQKLIDEYEKSHNPYSPMYVSMLSSARNAKNSALAQKIFHRIEHNFSKDKNCLVPAQVLLANTYGLAGNKSMASNIRMKLHKDNAKKLVALTWTYVNGKLHKFRANEQSHPQLTEINEELARILDKLIDCYGYKPDDSWITRPLNNDETIESALSSHSERLAIAFNLIQRPIPSRIQIVKNLRICDDCHTVTKLIAQMYQCLIVVRDANRIHHFYPNGQCSCQDHF